MITQHLRHCVVAAAILLFSSMTFAQQAPDYPPLRLEGIFGSFGSGLGQFNSPSGLAIADLNRDGYLDVVVADTGNNRIQRINFNTPTGDPDFDLIAGPGSEVGKVSQPKGIDVDTQRGLLFVADTGNNRIQRATFACCTGDPDFDLIAGSGSSLGQVNAPQGVAYDSLNDILYIADTGNNRIQSASNILLVGDTDFDLFMGPGSNLGEVMSPNGISKGREDNDVEDEPVFIADTGNNRIQRATFDPLTGDPDFDLLMEPGTGLGQVTGPGSIVSLPAAGHNPLNRPAFIFVADTGNNRVQVGSVDSGNNINWQFVGGGSLSMLAPEGLAVGDINRDGRPDLLVADTGNNRLLLFAGVPEPSAAVLAGLAMFGLLFGRRRPIG
jgi:DNA-binding beta-propeller fold protein YncE